MSQVLFKPQEWFASRLALREDFLRRYDLAQAQLVPVGFDAAFRRYFRLQDNDGRSLILMECVPDGQEIANPGHGMADYVRIGTYLRDIGISAPRVFEADMENGYLLLEDFGDLSFKKAQEADPAQSESLYELATDILSSLRQHAELSKIDLPDYYKNYVHINRRRLIDWYFPAIRGEKNADGLAEEYLQVWDGIEQSLPPVPMGFLHMDYHFENLMWVEGASGLDRCGVLDFQGAMRGPMPYDLANLLEDARVDVPADLRARMMERYCRSMGVDERRVFQDWYRVLATQFHCRVIGQFIRLAVRDGKPRYLEMIPRVAGYLREGLKDPVLKPLADWLAAQEIDFSRVDGFAVEAIRMHIREDAF